MPPGFSITTAAYNTFLDLNNLRMKIEPSLEHMDSRDANGLNEVSHKIRDLIERAEMPSKLARGIREAYQELQVGEAGTAVRSSASAEDLQFTSFAGQMETFLFVRGIDNVSIATKKVFSSLFTPRAIAYRVRRSIGHLSMLMSVGVQRMINPESAGVMFTLNPLNGDREVVYLEGVWGAGESLVRGHVSPDSFVVRKSDLSVLKRSTASKNVMTAMGQNEGEFSVEIPVPQSLRDAPSLTTEQVLELARHALRVEEHYTKPMDVEWVVEKNTGKIFLVQARPVTT